MNRSSRLIAVTLAVVCMVAVANPAYSVGKGKGPNKVQGQGHGQGHGKAHKRHGHSGRKLLGEKIHKNGAHVMDKVGKNTVSAVVKNGKIAGVKVKHAEKGDVAVKKYKSKSTQQLGQAPGNVATFASNDPTLLAQYDGWTWIGYSFIDDYGDEQIYWFPYEMVYDGDADAILYVPAEDDYYYDEY